MLAFWNLSELGEQRGDVSREGDEFIWLEMQRDQSIGEVQLAAAADIQRRLPFRIKDILHDWASLVLVISPFNLQSSTVATKRDEARPSLPPVLCLLQDCFLPNHLCFGLG